MFDRLFAFIRRGVRDAILGGFQDAHDELNRLAETGEPIALEDASGASGSTGNGKASTSKSRRKSASR